MSNFEIIADLKARKAKSGKAVEKRVILEDMDVYACAIQERSNRGQKVNVEFQKMFDILAEDVKNITK
ncbi:hypothetical protein [Yersinia phage MHG19]|nr:hypothetical protein [Yersinia phage MHG19]